MSAIRGRADRRDRPSAIVPETGLSSRFLDSGPRLLALPLSRRRFLAGLSGAVVGSPLVASCAKTAKRPTLGTGSGTLRILNWPAYIDTGEEGTVARFEAFNRFRPDYLEDYTDNADVFEKIEPILSTGGSLDYDIICPTFWLAARLVHEGWVEPLPLGQIPNHVNLDATFLRQPFDRGALYNLPWQSGITGIAYNTKLTKPVTTVEDLLNRADLKGKVGFFSEMRDSVGLAMLAMRRDPSRATARDALAALDVLREKKASGHIVKFANNEEYLAALKSGEFAACVAWSGDIVQLKDEQPEFEFAVPEDGAMQFFDTMVIPKRAPNGDAAATWMNFVYDPANAARITSAVKYISPVIGVADELRKLGGDAAKLADNPIVFPDALTRRRLYTWNGPTAGEEDRLAASFASLVAS